jgi:glutamate carboxypeptidase
MNKEKIEKYFTGRKETILESIRELVEIESPSFDVNGNKEAVDFLVRKAQKLLCVTQIERIFSEGFGEHLILNAFEGNPQNVLLLGHTDTVHPRETKKRNPTRIEGDKFYGCGIFDMKANCILILEILLAFEVLNIKPRYSFTVLLSCDEEIGSESGREFVEREAKKAEFCLVCEPSANGKAKTGRKGTAGFTVKAHGIPAHAGLEPEKGASAILELSKQIPIIQELNAPELGTTANVCTIQGGTTSNVIPAEAECSIDVRFTKLSEAHRIESAIRALKTFNERVSIEVSGEINRPPMERTPAIVELYKKAKAVADSMNYEFGETQVGGASDGNFVGALGIPVLDGLGITGNGAHTLDEYILISDISKRATLLSLLLSEN